MPSFSPDRFRVERTESARVLPVPASHRWIYAHHPEGWEVAEVDGADRWVPSLRRFRLVPGVNGTDMHGNSSKLQYRFGQLGWTFIENGGPAGTYSFECAARGGFVWLDKWTTINEYVPGKVKKVMTPEARADFNLWRAGLVDSGALKAPEPFMLEHICETYHDTHIDRLAALAGNVAVDRKVVKAEKMYARMLAASLEAPEPAPKSTRTRTK